MLEFSIFQQINESVPWCTVVRFSVPPIGTDRSIAEKGYAIVFDTIDEVNMAAPMQLHVLVVQEERNRDSRAILSLKRIFWTHLETMSLMPTHWISALRIFPKATRCLGMHSNGRVHKWAEKVKRWYQSKVAGNQESFGSGIE